MFRIFPKSFLLVSAFCLIFAASGSSALAQCGGVYFKPTTRKALGEKVYLNIINDELKDLTGDGKLDLLGFVRDANDAYSKIYILPGTGTGDFGAAIQITLPASSNTPPDYKIADTNADGKNDLLVRLETNPVTVTVYLNNGGGAFTALPPTIFPSNEQLVNWIDINGDGRADLISELSPPPYTNFYRLANADGTFGASVQLSYAHYHAAGDFNSDGKVDFPVISETGGNFSLRIYFNDGNGIFALGSNPLMVDSRYPVLRKVADFNNDAKPDLLFFIYGDEGNLSKIVLVTNLGGGNFSRTEFPLPFGNLLREPVVKDFNGDGLPDVIAFNTNTTGVTNLQYAVLTNNGAGGFTSRVYNGRFPGLPVDDLDGDDKADFLSISSFDYQNNGIPIKVFDETQISVLKNVCNRFGQTRIVDFDGDGLADTAFWRESDGRWRYQQRSYPYNTITFNWGQAGDVPMPGDYDGDGRTDYAVFRPSTGAWYYVNSSDGSFSGVAFGISGDRPVASDYNGDGKTDVAVYRLSTGTWYVLYSGTNQFYGAQFGASEDKPVPQDYDGDGKTDFAVFRPSTGVWYVLRSSDNASFGEPWGTNTDTLVPADYDGDGRADLAVFRAGNWFIRRSNNLPAAGRLFGNPTDIPQPSDWNGDGIWDLTVYRPSNKIWYTAYYTFIDFSDVSGEVPISSLNKSY